MTGKTDQLEIKRSSYDFGNEFRYPDVGYLHLPRRPDSEGGPYGLVDEVELLAMFKKIATPENIESPNHRVWAGAGGQQLVYGAAVGYEESVKPMFARPNDATLHDWMKRICQEEHGENYTALSNDPQTFGQNDKAFMRRVTRFLRPILEQMGHAPDGCRTFCFTGRYPLTPFGVHIEDFHNFFFPIVGHRRLYMWPAEYPASIGATTFSNATDLTPWLDDAIIFDLKPGDLMYWAPKMWHILGSPDPREAHVTFSVMWRDHHNAQQLPNPSKQFQTIVDLGKNLVLAEKGTRALEERGVTASNGHVELPASIHEIVRTWDATFKGRSLVVELWRCWLSRVSGSGLLWSEDFGPMPTVKRDEQFAQQPDVDLHWVNLGDGRALWAASSKVFEIDATWLPALRTITSGVTVTSASLGEIVSGSEQEATELVQRLLWVDALRPVS